MKFGKMRHQKFIVTQSGIKGTEAQGLNCIDADDVVSSDKDLIQALGD